MQNTSKLFYGDLADKCQKWFYDADRKTFHRFQRKADYQAPAHIHTSDSCHFIYFDYDLLSHNISTILFHLFQAFISHADFSSFSSDSYDGAFSTISPSSLLFLLLLSVSYTKFFSTVAWCTHQNSRMNCCLEQIAFEIFVRPPTYR